MVAEDRWPGVIIEWLAQVVAAIAEFIAGLFGDLQAPGWLQSAGDTWQSIMGQAAGLDPWIPWSVLSAVVTSLLACVVIGFGIKVVRMVLSLFTGGGGSAA